MAKILLNIDGKVWVAKIDNGKCNLEYHWMTQKSCENVIDKIRFIGMEIEGYYIEDRIAIYDSQSGEFSEYPVELFDDGEL